MTTEVELKTPFNMLWAGQDVFAAAQAIEGETHRALEQRQTLSFSVENKRYFIKRHKGSTWREVLKNLVQLRLPVVSARNEWRAISQLQALGIQTPRVVAYGRRGMLPATLESFIVTEDVGTHESLEEHCGNWLQQAPDFVHKHTLLKQVAEISRSMHGAGICHRDFYICHLLLMPDGSLTVIDLHRALCKKHLGKRWIIKDLAGLYFSSLECGLTRRDVLRFIRYYSQCPLRQVLQEQSEFWRAVKKRGLKLYGKDSKAKQ